MGAATSPPVPYQQPVLDGGSTKIEQSIWVRWLSQLVTSLNALIGTVNSQWANVLDYGATGDGVTDDSAAVDRATASLPAEGGTVFFPAGRTYLINWTILRPKIRVLGGAIGRVNSSAFPAGLSPFDPSLPVITIGNDTALLEGVVLDSLEFNGLGVGFYGLRLFGGCYRQDFYNLTIQGFTKKGLHINGGATFPCAYLRFFGLGLQMTDTVALEQGIIVNQGATYVEAIDFFGLNLSGGTHGYALNNAGSKSLSFTGSYLQVQDGHGVLLSMPGTVKPFLNGNALSIDSDNSADTLVEVNFGPSTLPIEDYVIGFVDIDGKVNINGTLLVNQSPMHLPFRTKMVFGTAFGALYLADSAAPNATSMSLSGNTTIDRSTWTATSHVMTGLVKCTGLPVYADNAAAILGGLSTDFLYYTATGELRIVV